MVFFIEVCPEPLMMHTLAPTPVRTEAPAAFLFRKRLQGECGLTGKSHLDVDVVGCTLRAAVGDHDGDQAGIWVLVAAPLHATAFAWHHRCARSWWLGGTAPCMPSQRQMDIPYTL